MIQANVDIDTFHGESSRDRKQELEQVVTSEKVELTPLFLDAIQMFKGGDHVGNKHCNETCKGHPSTCIQCTIYEKHEEDQVDAVVGWNGDQKIKQN